MGSIFSSPIETKIGIFGHREAGKTTIINVIKGDRNAEAKPTIQFVVQQFNKYGINFTAWDVSGRDHRPALRRGFYSGMQGVIFVLDSSNTNPEELNDAFNEFEQMVQAPKLENSVFLLLANKQDLPDALTIHEVHARIGTMDIKQKIHVAAVSAKTDPLALEESFNWLVEQLKTRN